MASINAQLSLTLRIMLLIAVCPTPALHAEPLMGDVAAALSTPEAAEANPANAAFVDRTQLQMSPIIYKSDTINARYPGYPAVNESKSSVGDLMSARPSFVIKATPNLGISGYFLPALPLKMGITMNRVPVVILRTQNFVDIYGKGHLKGIGQFTAGFKVSRNFAIGLGAFYQALGFEASMRPSESSGDPLAEIQATLSELSVLAGVRGHIIPGRFSAGLSLGLVTMQTEKLAIDSPLFSQTEAGTQEVNSKDGINAAQPLGSVLLGMQLLVTPRLRIYADVKYTRAPKGGETMSLVELKNKSKDVYDVLGVRTALTFTTVPHGALLLGFKYEPTTLGPGSRGEDGKIGFGSIDLIMARSGFGDMTPYYQVSMGLQHGFSPQTIGKDQGDYYYRWILASGLVYRRASLGVDEDGELPGAYLQTKTFLPMRVVVRF